MQRRCPEGPPLAQAAARRPPRGRPAGWCWSWPWRCTPSAGRTLQRYAMGLLGHHGVAVITRATKVVDVMGPRWWTLHSQSLEILPTGTWRSWRPSPPEARQAWSSCASRSTRSPAATCWCCEDGVLDRRALAIGKRAWILGPGIQLELAVYATQVETRSRPTGPCFPRRSPCTASPFPPTLSDPMPA